MTEPAVEPDVVVVGAGPTGLVAALLLARLGVRVLVLERHAEPYGRPRAVHVDDEVFRILQAAGVGEAFARVGRPAAGLRLLSAGHRVIAEFRRDRLEGVHGHPQSTLFDQPDLERLLRAEVARRPGVRLVVGARVTDVSPAGRVEYVTGDGDRPRRVRAAAVLGCDGANSTVRQRLGIGLDDLGFEQRWLVVDVRSRPAAPGWRVWDGVEQVCDPARAATAMWIGRDRYRFEFRLHPGERADDLSAPDRLARLLAPWAPIDGPGGGRAVRAGGVDPAVAPEVLRAAEYTFRARVADRWRAGRVFLLGDAAHQTPPFVGQGLGSGLRDAHNLAWKLARVLTGGDGPAADERLLDSYQRERSPHARALVRLAVLAGWAMTGGQDRAAAVRRPLVAGLCRLPGATALLLDRAGPPLRPGPVVRRRGPAGRLRSPLAADPAGRPVPQPWVDVLAGGPGRGRARLDDVLGPGWSVLVRGLPPDGPPPKGHTVPGGADDLAGRLGAHVVHVHPGAGAVPHLVLPTPTTPAGPTTAPRPTVVASPELDRWLRRHGVRAVLVRPDRAVLTALDGPG